MGLTAVVTGGTKGIGKALCVAFAGAGYDIVSCSRNAQELDLLAEELQVIGVGNHMMKADLSSVLGTKAFAQFVLNSVDAVDVLINNAGVFLPGSLLSEDEGNLDLMMKTNLYSAYHLSRSLVPRMVDQRKGHVFNICSVASIVAYPNGGSYSISKFAMLGFSKVLREEMKDKGVKVTSILPGATWSNSWKGVDLPFERLMPAEDIAAAVLSAAQAGPSTVVEEIVIRPQLGDL